ncbi:MAG: peptidyl-prolyl cis-trans isomerase [Desulfobacterota bacterium]|nr:peptidyl-prolyl cis-trans isomerase [Thermodesulfobacteriota bacterium]
MRRGLSYLGIWTFCLLWGCGVWERGLPDHLLAQIDGETISVEEFNRALKSLVIDLKPEGNRRDWKELQRALLDQLIDQKILSKEARRAGIRVTAEELNQALLDIQKDYPGEGLGEALGLRGMSLEEWKGRLEEKLLAEKMARNMRQYHGKIDEKAVREFYDTHRSLFRIPRRVRVRQIVVADGNEAILLQKRLKKGESFEKLAREKSIGPERVKGGDLGYFSEGEMPAEFDIVFSMEVGAISEVIKSPYGYHLFKVEEKLEPREIPFEEAKRSIQEKLERERGEEAYQRWLKELRSKAKVKVNKKWLRS